MFAELFAGVFLLLDRGLAGREGRKDRGREAVMADGDGRVKRGVVQDTLWERDELSIMHRSV